MGEQNEDQMYKQLQNEVIQIIANGAMHYDKIDLGEVSRVIMNKRPSEMLAALREHLGWNEDKSLKVIDAITTINVCLADKQYMKILTAKGMLTTPYNFYLFIKWAQTIDGPLSINMTRDLANGTHAAFWDFITLIDSVKTISENEHFEFPYVNYLEEYIGPRN